MFDIGFFELLVVGVIALTVLGPDQLWVAVRTIGRYVGRARHQMSQISYQIQQHEAMQGMNDLRTVLEEGVQSAEQAKAAAEQELGNLQGSFGDHISDGQSIPDSLRDAQFSELSPMPTIIQPEAAADGDNEQVEPATPIEYKVRT